MWFFLILLTQTKELCFSRVCISQKIAADVAFLADLCDRYVRPVEGQLLIGRDTSCVFVPVGDACRVCPVDGKLAPHPADVQATSTKLYSENGCNPGAQRQGRALFNKNLMN